MTGDVCRAITGKAPRKTEKRKKRRLKKTPSQAKQEAKRPESAADTLNPQNMTPPALAASSDEVCRPERPFTNTHVSGHMSPRKQALMRHKSTNESIAEPLFVSEVKEYKRNRKPVPKPASADADDGKYSLLLANQSMEGKAALFMAPAARIVLYHEHPQDSPLRASPGTLLAHGEFEIFQLHGGDVTYLACGKTFVYPLLPRLKILRTSSCEFVLPLVNPQRYWKINIDTNDDTVFLHLEQVLQKVVKYTNLAVAEQPTETIEQSEDARAGHVSEPLPMKTLEHKQAHYTPLFNDIPESPPSAPISPQQTRLYKDMHTFTPPDVPFPPWELPVAVKHSVQSVTSGMANFKLEDRQFQDEAERKKLVHTRPHAHSNPFYYDQIDGLQMSGSDHQLRGHHVTHKAKDVCSESSSMDSLLDEYEETVLVTKSIHHSISRPQSTAASHVSAARSTARSALKSVRGMYDPEPDMEHRLRARPHIDLLPATSLSRYEKARHNSLGGRSRQSSISELYSSTSNWMEPGQMRAKVISSKLTCSVAPKNHYPSKKEDPQNLSETYREIYRLITSHSPAHIAGNDGAVASAPVILRSKELNPPIKPQTKSAGLGEVYPGKHVNFKASHRNMGATRGQGDGLSSLEVFKLLSERDKCAPQAPTGLRRLFGW